jgi:S1-C subfamily serine protease
VTTRHPVIRLYAALFVLLLAFPALGEPLPDVIERVAPSVVGVGAAYPARAPTGGRPAVRLLGTGFALMVGDRPVIVTNAHVIPEDLDIDRREQLAVFAGRGAQVQPRAAQPLAIDREHDLAVLAYEGAPLPALTLAANDRARPGERVAFTGFPIGAVLGLYPATQEGIIAAVTPVARPANSGRDLDAVQMRRLRSPFDVYQLDAIAYPGNSGSAVYRQETGEVIGVMNSVFVKESRESLLSAPSGIAFVIPVRHLRALIGTLD